MNSILVNSRQINYYTYLNPIFESINNKQIEYNWLLTDLELNWIPDDFLEFMEQYEIHQSNWDRANKYWMSGVQFTNLIIRYDIQFIWGVLTGFNKSEIIDIKNLEVEPYADGNKGFWIPGATMQYPTAELEIVCWDSTLTLLISKDQTIVEDFRAYFKDARDLDEYNLKD